MNFKFFLLKLFIIAGIPFIAGAQDNRFEHIKPELAPVGQIMELNLKLKVDKKFGFPVILHLVRDGQLIRLRLPEGLPGMDDFPTYSFKVVAPEKSMSYTFYVKEDDKFSASSRFTYSRPCLPQTEPVTIPKVPEFIKDQDVAPIAAKVRLLELENTAIENNINLLSELAQLLTDLKGHE
jgi:hypothetical protein